MFFINPYKNLNLLKYQPEKSQHPYYDKFLSKARFASAVRPQALFACFTLCTNKYSCNVKPFLLLDSHGSRLGLPFLKYVNNEAHQWVVYIGFPYGRSYWEVGDSPEQNGCYKMALTSEKAALVLKKQRH